MPLNKANASFSAFTVEMILLLLKNDMRSKLLAVQIHTLAVAISLRLQLINKNYHS